MLELSKKVLLNVSFDSNLFYKELKKAIQRIYNQDDLLKLKNWCEQHFSDVYPQIIKVSFSK